MLLFCSVVFAKCTYKDQVKEDEMRMGEEECMQSIGGKAGRKETTRNPKR
jgi:hypothetical protein